MLFDIVRPNESDQIKDYRDNVRRDITSEGPHRWIQKVSRIFVEHGINVDESTLSDVLSDWLASKPFKVLGRNVELSTFMYDRLLPATIEDPNAVILPLPVVAENILIPPQAPPEDGGLLETESVDVMTVMVPSFQIVFFNQNVFSWEAGQWVVDDKTGETMPYYFIVDQEAYYRYIPVKEDRLRFDNRGGLGNKKIYYQLQSWYFHELDILPICVLGGVLSKPGDIEFYDTYSMGDAANMLYYESFIRSYFELADEVTISFSDNQAVRLLHSYPKVVMAQIPCTNTDCKSGRIITYSGDGKKESVSACPVCKGKQFIDNPSPYGVLIRGDSAAMGGVADTRPTMEYITPPEAIIETSYKVPWDLLTRAKQSIGLDLLEDVAESGTAKRMRLEDLNDMLRSVSHNFHGVISRYLAYVEGLLVVDEDLRQEPRLTMPVDLQYKTANSLKEDADEALPVDKYKATLEYLHKKYINSPVIFKQNRLSLKWAPILLDDPQVITLKQNAGVYTARDLWKLSYASIIFDEISMELSEDVFLDARDLALITRADRMLDEIIAQAPPSAIGGREEEE